MKIERKAEILERHFVPYYVEDDRIYVDSMRADSEDFEKVEDMTEWSITELYDWLGY